MVLGVAALAQANPHKAFDEFKDLIHLSILKLSWLLPRHRHESHANETANRRSFLSPLGSR